MNTKQTQIRSKRVSRKIFWRRPQHHDPMLVLNMALFNFTDGWSRTFSKYQYARHYA